MVQPGRSVVPGLAICLLREHTTQQPIATSPDARQILSICGGYFWFYAAIGAFMPFAALYYRDLGFSGLQVGLLTALPSLAAALLGPVLGALADSRALHGTMLRVSLLLAALFAFTITRFTSFVPVAMLVGLLAVSAISIPPLLDSYAMTTSDKTGRSFGSLRVWGSLGYMGLTLLMGWLIGDTMSPVVLVGYGCCLSLTLVSSLGLRPLAERRPRSLIDGLGEAIRIRPLVLLLVIAYLLASCSSLMNVYLGVHLESLGAGAGVIGIAFSVSALSELPIVAGGGWFLRKLGPVNLMLIAIATYTVRFVILAVVTDPNLVIASQLLHGLSYGAFLMASVTLAHRAAGTSLAATAQSLLGAMSFGLGSITGSLSGGALLDQIGTDGLYRGAAIVTLVVFGIAFIGARRIPFAPPPSPL